MIKANELRIGNAIWDDTRNKVKWVNHRVISDLASHASPLPYSPIPLTHEWLERCGFTIPDEHGYMMRVNKGVVRIKIDDRLKFPSVKIGDLHCAVTPFVHQLQNLYFALTGEELTINLNP